MKEICGIEASASLGASRRARRAMLRPLLAAAVFVTLAAPPAALSAGGGSAPSPERLWRSYPLDSAHKKLRPAASTAASPRATRTAAAQSSADVSWPVWLGILVGVLVLAAGAYALVRRRVALRLSVPRDLVRRARQGFRLSGTAASAPVQPTELAIAGDPPRERPLNGELLGEAKRVGVAAAAVPASLSPPRPEPAKPPDETVLKRKQRSTDPAIQTLKQKRPAAGARAQELGVLKEKLGEPAERRTNGASAAASRASAPAPPPAAVRPPARAAGRPSCRIEWWRGYVKSEFQARVRRVDGSEAILLTSPAFRWTKSTPPPRDLPHVESAHAALLAELEAAGWRPRRRGTQWFSLELQLGHDLPERKGRHEHGS